MAPVPAVRQAGRFSYDVATGGWQWDEDVFRIHGYRPGSVEPTTELIFGHKHPDDRARFEALIDRASRVGGRFSLSYRVIGGDGVERRVVLVGEGHLADHGRVSRIAGYYIDLTRDFLEEAEEYAAAAVEASAQSRACIEQAKGALMLAYGLDSEQAFSMLRWWSRNRNVKVRDLAERLVDLARAGELADSDVRTHIDEELHELSVHHDPAM